MQYLFHLIHYLWSLCTYDLWAAYGHFYYFDTCTHKEVPLNHKWGEPVIELIFEFFFIAKILHFATLFEYGSFKSEHPSLSYMK